METEESHEQALAISRIVDQVSEEFLGDDPHWGPLHTVLPLEWCDGFMWMYRLAQDDAVLEHYKHGITRRYLVIDQNHRTYVYNGDTYDLIPVALAVERVFEGIEEMGWTRHTRYDEEFVTEKHRQWREAGWTVITTASPLEAGLADAFARLDQLSVENNDG
jgi:hypothetical protein